MIEYRSCACSDAHKLLVLLLGLPQAPPLPQGWPNVSVPGFVEPIVSTEHTGLQVKDSLSLMAPPFGPPARIGAQDGQ